MTATTIAVLEVDLETNALGLTCRAAEDLDGRSVLRATVENLLAYGRVGSVAIVCPATARSAVAALVEGLAVTWHEPAADHPMRARWRRGRKWGLSGWRGGLAGTTVFDEWGSPATLRRVLAETGAPDLVKPGVLNPLVDGALLVEFLEAARASEQDALFLPTPPGANFEYYRPSFLDSLIARGATIREAMILYTDRTNRDPVLVEAFHRPGEAVIEGRHRIAADTARGLEVVRDLRRAFAPGPAGWSSAALDGHLLASPEVWHRRLPRELEVEITGRDDLPAPQRPRPRRDRPDLPFDVFARLVDELATYDDACLTLGGWGDPLLSKDLPRMLERARAAGVWGLHVATSGLSLSAETIAALVDARVDAVTVAIDAERPEVYQALNGIDALERVTAGVEALIAASEALGAEGPFVVPEMVKRAETMDDLEAFFDRWYAATGWVVLRPHEDYCGQREDRNPLPFHLSRRSLCRRIQEGLVVLVDGTVPVCGMDYLGRWPAGDVGRDSLESIWTGPTLTDLRAGQAAGRYDGFPLCSPCRAWWSL